MRDNFEGPMLEAVKVCHRYGDVTALNNVSLSAEKGEFLTILGSSGSGKTTMLRVISGLEHPQAAERLTINGIDVLGMPPAKRSCTTVFQSYALFPHMNVMENVSYGLRVRKVNQSDAAREARRALAMVRLEEKAERHISQLSGGERQRVALARAVVTRPAVLLLDEPLGALDELLRQNMQLELTELQRSLGITFIYITHSQEEALTMSDRVVLMRQGEVVQAGRPLELFDRPINHYAAEFMGYENILCGRFLGCEGRIGSVELAGGVIVKAELTSGEVANGEDVEVAIRAERVSPNRENLDNTLAATLKKKVYHGKYTDREVETSAGTLKLRNWAGSSTEGMTDEIGTVGWQIGDAVIYRSGVGT